MKKYIQIYEKIKNEIVAHKYEYGAKIPSKRTIAENNGVSVITVEQALDLLLCEGYIKSVERSGYFVCYRDDLYGKKSGYKPENGTFNSERTNKPLLTAPHINSDERRFYFPMTAYASAVRKTLSERDITEKSPNYGLYELRKAVADYLFRNRGINVGVDRIIIGAGAEYLYGTFAEVLGERIFAIENPCYDKIKRVYSSRNITFESLPLTENGIPSESLAKSNASVLHITPYQSYPTGVTIDVSKKKEYIDFADRRNGFVIEDDYASEFSFTSKISDTLFAYDKFDRVIYINSFSKTIFPSVRAAYAVLPERLREEYAQKASFYSCPVPVLEQYVLAEILDSGSFERHINKVRRLFSKST